MKKYLITSLFLAAASASALSPAMAEKTSIEVLIPTNITEPAVAEAYKAELTSAIRKVCRRATGPAVGISYYNLIACIEHTTEDVAESDPTGLLAASIGQPRTVVLADQSVR